VKPDVVLNYAGEEYGIFVEPEGFRASGPSPTICSVIEMMMRSANESYSPASGSRIAYLSRAVSSRLRAEIKAIRVEKTQRGVVY
jgi:hypothetical protein